MKKYGIARIIGLLAFVFVSSLFAQNTGVISGTARDSSGAAMPNTRIVILDDDTGNSRTVETDAAGHYSAPALGLGNYRVTASREGFQTVIRTGIVLAVGQDVVVDLTLTVGAVGQTLEVAGEVSPIESTSASLGSLVDSRTIRALPLNGRSYDQLALIQPGVTQLNPGTTTNSTLRVGTGVRWSVGGQRSGTNSFLLDGANVSDQGNSTPGGASGTNLGVDTILEFKVYTNSYKAEYGRTSGGIVSAITRSGTNTLHGTVFEYIRNSVLDARNFFDVSSSPPPFKRNQFGGVLGGPIRKNKTFFFVGFEGVRQGQESTQIAIVPSATARQGILPTGNVTVSPAIVPYFKFFPLPNLTDFGDGTGFFASAPNAITNDDNIMTRVDHQLTDKISLFARYSFDKDSVYAPLSLPSQVNDTKATRQSGVVELNDTLKANAFNNAHISVNRSSASFATLTIPAADPSTAFVPGEPLGKISIGGLQALGVGTITALGTGTLPELYGYTVYEEGDDFTWVKGRHTIKMGGTIQRVEDNFTNAPGGSGQYTFSSLSNFIQGKASNFQALIPSSGQFGLRQTYGAVYVQDDYLVNSRLTFNLGFRWETISDPSEVNGRSAILPSPSAPSMVIASHYFTIGKKNFEPRFGMALRLDQSGKTVLRVGGGIYHNELFPAAYFTQTRSPFYNTLSLNNAPFPNGYQSLLGSTGLQALAVSAPFMKTPVVDQYNVSLQREITPSTVIQVDYSGNHSNHLITQTELDRYVPTILPNGTEFFPVGDTTRMNPAFTSIREWQTNSNSNYNAGTVTIRRRAAGGADFQVFYTFSKALDVASSTGSVESSRAASAIMDPDNAHLDYGLAEFNVEHSVSGNVTYPLPFHLGSRAGGALVNGWTLDALATFQTGQPLTPRLAASNSRDGSGTLADRPNLVAGFNNNPTSGTTGAGCAGAPAGQPVGTAARWYNPCAFTLPTPGTYGNLGRNTVIGPGVENINAALEKDFRPVERMRVTFRAEVFNIMNHTNFGLPNTTALTSTGAVNGAAGSITYTITSSRQLQFAVKVNF